MNFLTGAFAAKHNCHTLGIRSEHIDIVDDGEAEWTGTVIHAEDLGSDNYLFVEIGAPEPLIVRRPGKLHHTNGTRLNLRPQARTCIVSMPKAGHVCQSRANFPSRLTEPAQVLRNCSGL